MLLTRTSSRERLALQICVSLAAAVPVTAGLWDVAHGHAGADPWAVNHHRYLSGLLLAIGLGFWSAVPHIENKMQRLRLLTLLVFAGGLSRLLGLALGDPPTPFIVAALAMELLVAPLLCLWQGRVAGVYNPVSFIGQRGESPWPPRWQSSASAD
ncbi:MAG: DUF4345 domain-containing protein [Reyranellales bacterium]